MSKTSAFEEQLAAILERDTLLLLERIDSEALYAVAFHTSGEGDYSYVAASANTEERLVARAKEYAEKYPKYSRSDDQKRLRWSTCDWGYHNFSPEIAALQLPLGEGRRRDASIYKAFVKGLKRLQELDPLKRRAQRPMFLITCGDMSDEFFFDGLQRLNPAEMIEAYVSEFTAAPFIQWLNTLPRETRLDTVATLYRDMSLRTPSKLALDAAARNVTRYDIQALFRSFDDDGASRLLDLIEEFGFGEPFTQKGSDAYEKFGAITGEDRMCSAAIFTLTEWPALRSEHILRMQKLLARRVEMDRTRPMASTFAENIARVLHQLRPRSFPRSELDPKTNHLRNPDPFLPRP